MFDLGRTIKINYKSWIYSVQYYSKIMSDIQEFEVAHAATDDYFFYIDDFKENTELSQQVSKKDQFILYEFEVNTSERKWRYPFSLIQHMENWAGFY